MKFWISIYIIFVLITGCTTMSTSQLPIITSTIQPSSSPTLTVNVSTQTKLVDETATHIPKATLTPTPTSLNYTSTPTPDIETIVPEVVKVCPERLEVPLAELGLPPTYRLILAPADNDNFSWGDTISDGILIMSGDDSTPEKIYPPSIKDDEWKLYIYYPGPSNNEWIGLDYKREANDLYSIWIGNLDGVNKWEVMKTTYYKTVLWFSDNEMVVLGSPREEEYTQGRPPYEDNIPLYSVNPFTKEIKPLPLLPDGAIYDFYFSQNNNSYVVYYFGSMGYGPYTKFVLYNYTNNTSKSVFQWMTGKSFGDWAGVGIMKNGLFYASVSRSYGFDIAFDLDMEAISKQTPYNEIMKKIILPGGEDKNLLTTIMVEYYKNIMPVYRYDYTLMKFIYFFILDYKNMKLLDYCLDPSGDLDFSPDQRFITQNIPELQKAIILELTTGRMVTLDGYQVIGWSEVK